MKEIIIIAKGDALATEKIVSLFNGGDRIHTRVILSEITDEALKERLSNAGCNIVPFNLTEWNEHHEEFIKILEGVNPCLIVLDGWTHPVPADIAKITGYHVLQVTSPEEAPKEVVKAIESIDISDFDTPEPAPEQQKSMDEEWAESLQMNFDTQKLNLTPPPLPPEDFSLQTEYQGAPPVASEQQNFAGEFSSENIGAFSPDNRGERQPERRDQMPSTYLIWSVLCTIFCCFIPGIVAIIFSSQVSTKYYAGDMEGARRASRNAEAWIIVSFVLGVLTATLYLPLMIIN